MVFHEVSRFPLEALSFFQTVDFMLAKHYNPSHQAVKNPKLRENNDERFKIPCFRPMGTHNE